MLPCSPDMMLRKVSCNTCKSPQGHDSSQDRRSRSPSDSEKDHRPNLRGKQAMRAEGMHLIHLLVDPSSKIQLGLLHLKDHNDLETALLFFSLLVFFQTLAWNC